MAVDYLGRELADAAPKAQTVAEFAVQQGTMDSDGAGVQDAIKADRKHSARRSEHARMVSDRMAAPPAPASSAQQDSERTQE